MSFPLRALSLLALGLLSTVSLAAQTKVVFPDPSPTATLSQRVGVTDFTLVYARPGVKGRKIFGGLVPYDEVWRTGANAATQLTISTPVALNGTAVAAGTYELFTIPTVGAWTVILQKSQGQWGAYTYNQKNDVVRFPATPEKAHRPVETLAFGFTDIKPDSATLCLEWDTVRLPIKVTIDVVAIVVPQIQAAMAGTGKKPYYQAAQFYFDYNLDLKQAIAWIDEAIRLNPKSSFDLYHKATFLARMGDKAGAIAAARQSMAIVDTTAEPERSEYLHLNQAVIDGLK